MTDDDTFETLLQFLKENRGFDFTGYKRSSLQRRVDRRMQQVGVTSFDEYTDLLQVDHGEFTALFDTILINVTGFFRDQDAWDELQDQVLPRILASKSRDEPVRVWSAGCASGEEAYGLAIVLTELLGPQDFRQRVKIYATDVDEEALSTARQARYSEQSLQNLPTELRERYFEPNGAGLVFRADLRRNVIFGRNDLVQDAPIGRLDLLVCRNTLMYLTAETQTRVLNRFHFALNPDGALFLGKAEMLLSHSRLFVPINSRRRFFRRGDQPSPNGRAPRNGSDPPPGLPIDPVTAQLEDETLMSSPLATVLVGDDAVVIRANRRAESQLGISPDDVGRQLSDLEQFRRIPGLREAYQDVLRERTSRWLTDVEWDQPSAERLYFDIQLVPFAVPHDSDRPSVALYLADITRYRRSTDELHQAHRQVEAAYEELQSTVEELETTNEELQSTVEELETTNEELQSTNEELETMNDELNSTNDELQATNVELSNRTDQLDDANRFLESVLAGLRTAVVVVDRELVVDAWNRRADDLWGLRSDETVGQHLLNLDIGLPTDELRPLVREVLRTGEQSAARTVEAINRRGRTVALSVLATPRFGRDGESYGVIVLMDEQAGPA